MSDMPVIIYYDVLLRSGETIEVRHVATQTDDGVELHVEPHEFGDKGTVLEWFCDDTYGENSVYPIYDINSGDIIGAVKKGAIDYISEAEVS